MRLYTRIQYQKIIALLRKGKTPKQVAEKFSLGTDAVYKAVRKSGFKNLTQFYASIQ